MLTRIRLRTDQRLYVDLGEGYGASHALTEVRDALERQFRDKKSYGRSKIPASTKVWITRLG